MPGAIQLGSLGIIMQQKVSKQVEGKLWIMIKAVKKMLNLFVSI